MMAQIQRPVVAVKQEQRPCHEPDSRPTFISIRSVAIPGTDVEPQIFPMARTIPLATTTRPCSQQNSVSRSFVSSIISTSDIEKLPLSSHAIIEWYYTNSGTANPTRFKTRHFISNNQNNPMVVSQPTLDWAQRISDDYAKHARARQRAMMDRILRPRNNARCDHRSCCRTDALAAASFGGIRRRHRRQQQQKQRKRQPLTAAEVEDFGRQAQNDHRETGKTGLLVEYLKLQSALRGQ